MGTIVPEMGNRSKDSKVSIADALFSKTQQRVLGALFTHPDRSYSQTELFDLAGGRGTVQRELARLVASRLATVTTLGKRRLFRANTEAPVFEELQQLLVKTVGLVDPIRDALSPARAQIQLALIYGSVAKGHAHAASDVDLLVVSDSISLEQLLERLIHAERRIQRPINPTLLRRAEYEKRRSQRQHFLTAILSGPHIAIVGEADSAPEAR